MMIRFGSRRQCPFPSEYATITTPRYALRPPRQERCDGGRLRRATRRDHLTITVPRLPCTRYCRPCVTVSCTLRITDTIFVFAVARLHLECVHLHPGWSLELGWTDIDFVGRDMRRDPCETVRVNRRAEVPYENEEPPTPSLFASF